MGPRPGRSAAAGDALRRETRVVVVFDICSSTSILEDLKQTDHLDAWRDLLIGLKNFLRDQSETLRLELYKFIGDGWLLLLPASTTKLELFVFLRKLSGKFETAFGSIRNLLQQQFEPIGLTFGVDYGELVRLTMNQQVEYIGRAINVASRLQSATKELSGGPAYKALLTKHCFNSLKPVNHQIKFQGTRLKLRNINAGAPCECVECDALHAVDSADLWRARSREIRSATMPR